MKKLLIINTYPKTKKQKTVLKDCIKSLKSFDWDILVVSHYPIPLDIQEMVSYCIYDKNNLFVPPEITPHIFSSNEFFESKIYTSGHALAISINMYNSFEFAKSNNYDFCYYMECDNILSLNDVIKLKNLVTIMENEKKDMIIFNPIDYIVGDCYHGESGSFFYETLLFGAKPNIFLSNFKPPRNLNEWYSNNMCYNLESTFYEKFKNLKTNCLIIPFFVNHYLSDSNVNLHKFGTFVCEIIYNQTDPNTPILFMDSVIGGNATKEIKIYKNGQYFDGITINPGTWYYLPLKINNDKIKIEVFDDNILDFSSEYKLDNDFLITLKDGLSHIKFK
jgi:hypothetical protein